jgi:hypothetical protein
LVYAVPIGQMAPLIGGEPLSTDTMSANGPFGSMWH